MDKSLKDIIALYKDCSKLIDKRAGWLTDRLKDVSIESLRSVPFIGSFVDPVKFLSFFGKVFYIASISAKNLISSLSNLSNELQNSKSGGDVVWNSLADTYTKKINSYIPILSIKTFNPKPENVDNVKNNVSIIFKAKNILQNILVDLEYLLSKETYNLHKSDKIKTFCEIAKNQIIEYETQCTALLDKSKEFYQELSKQPQFNKDNIDKSVDEFLTGKKEEPQPTK